jgi:hypothetical protein
LAGEVNRHKSSWGRGEGDDDDEDDDDVHVMMMMIIILMMIMMMHYFFYFHFSHVLSLRKRFDSINAAFTLLKHKHLYTTAMILLYYFNLFCTATHADSAKGTKVQEGPETLQANSARFRKGRQLQL